jgi:hypothetical protein
VFLSVFSATTTVRDPVDYERTSIYLSDDDDLG